MLSYLHNLCEQWVMGRCDTISVGKDVMSEEIWGTNYMFHTKLAQLAKANQVRLHDTIVQ